jgi:hypothetical protein
MILLLNASAKLLALRGLPSPLGTFAAALD